VQEEFFPRQQLAGQRFLYSEHSAAVLLVTYLRRLQKLTKQFSTNLKDISKKLSSLFSAQVRKKETTALSNQLFPQTKGEKFPIKRALNHRNMLCKKKYVFFTKNCRN